MEIETDINRVRRLAAQKEDENWRFRSFLKCGIGLEVGDVFGYWLDFGDSWRHQVSVLTVQEKAPPGDYPPVTERVGESPPQYRN